MKPINVLSLFDGMSCGRIALDRCGIPVKNYFASEIKKSAIAVSQKNWTDITHIGDVKDVIWPETFEGLPIDLLIGGSPCQDFSVANAIFGERIGLEGSRSALFYEFLRLLKEAKPRYFLLENVKMKKGAKEQLDEYLGVEGVLIDSSLVSFQKRPRYYWTNIPNLSTPEDRGVLFREHRSRDKEYERKFKVNRTPSRERMWGNGEGRTSNKVRCPNISEADKIYCLTKKQDRSPNSGLVELDDFCRYLTREELEMAQTVPIGYTDCLSITQAQDVLGDGWTVDVIAHIFNGLKGAI